MAGTFATARAIGGLPVPVVAIALPRPAPPCFPDLDSRNPNRLRLISFFLARTRAAEGARPSSQRVAPAAAGLTGGEGIGGTLNVRSAIPKTTEHHFQPEARN